MEWVLTVIGIVTLTVVIMAFTMHFVMGKSSRIRASSIYIINAFEPDNTAPKITELIDFHKSHEKVKYIVD